MKLGKIERIVVYGIAIAGLVLGILMDLPLMQSLYSADNQFGRFMEFLGEIPIYVLGVFAAALLARFADNTAKRWLNILLTVVFIAAMIGVAIYGGKHFYDYYQRATKTVVPSYFVFLYGLVYLVLGAPWALLIDKEHGHDAVKYASIVALVIIAGLLVMQGAKMLWYRPRYRTLVALFGEEGAAKEFVAVYEPLGFLKKDHYNMESLSAAHYLGISKLGSGDFYSFFSGHTMNAVVCIALCGVTRILPSFQGKERTIRIVVYVYAIIVALSRMMTGAHYLTDVSTGFGIGVLLYDVLTTFAMDKVDALLDKAYRIAE